MSVRVKENESGRWEVDVRGKFPDGSRYRDRRRPEENWVRSRTAALAWGQDRERAIYNLWQMGGSEETKEIPTLAEFRARYLAEARANRRKPSTLDQKERMLRLYLVPTLGNVKLTEIRTREVGALKAHLETRGLSSGTVNQALQGLSKLLSVALDDGLIEQRPRIKKLPNPRAERPFLEKEDFVRLMSGAWKVGPEAHLVVLLGGLAGLRSSEIRALRWKDVDFKRERIVVARADWHGQISTPKGGHAAHIEMVGAVRDALAAHRVKHGFHELVVTRTGGRVHTAHTLRSLLERACAMAGIPMISPQILRHSFISHLVMEGVPLPTVQQYARHRTIGMTMTYVHLSPDHRGKAIHALERLFGGELGETKIGGSAVTG